MIVCVELVCKIHMGANNLARGVRKWLLRAWVFTGIVVGHPFHAKVVRDNVHFVEGKDERELALVQDGACVQHV